MANLSPVAVSIRRSPQPFQGFVLLVAFSVAGWVLLGIVVGGSTTNLGMALFGVAVALVGASLGVNVNGCADYMRESIRRDAPNGYDYFRYALAEGPGGARVPGISLTVIGAVLAGYAIAALAA